VIVWLDCRCQDLAPLREGLFRQILAASHLYIERIEHDVRLGRAKVLQKIEAGFALLVESDQFAIDYGLIGQSGQSSRDAFEAF
jgi:hypothetical protein